MKKIGVSHLVYIIIIFVIVLSFFLVIAFGGTKNASTMMGTASTVSSLILSVIAIVLSLLDVAGQRDSMVDLKETAEKLSETNETAFTLINNLIEKLASFEYEQEQIITSAVKSATETLKGSDDEWKVGLVKDIQNLIQKGNVENEDLNNLSKKIKEKDLTLDIDKILPEIKRDYEHYEVLKKLNEDYERYQKFKQQSKYYNPGVEVEVKRIKSDESTPPMP